MGTKNTGMEDQEGKRTSRPTTLCILGVMNLLIQSVMLHKVFSYTLERIGE